MLIFELLIEQTLTLPVSPLVGDNLRDNLCFAYIRG